MPRSKVTEEARRRVAKACLRCQDTKSKCDGLTPCALCANRGESSQCAYSAIKRSYGHRRLRQKSEHRENHQKTTTAESSANKPLHQEQIPVVASSEETRSVSSMREVTIPTMSQTLYDTRGRIGMYASIFRRSRGILPVALIDSLGLQYTLAVLRPLHFSGISRNCSSAS